MTVKNSRGRLGLPVLVLVVVVVSAAASLALLGGLGHVSTTSKVEAFTIIASVKGYNDSIDHGVPQSLWPVIQVSNGTMVQITVYNQDTQAHGFQITHYYDSSIETVSPGQKITVTFIANQKGTFKIYCSIFCTIHAFMQSGELVVT
ncbi:MAG TPA: cupredoxin domain-containing protein [Nitrososphaerales archaeon]|nr:cupredoxin domain-containing protein [Nitrososphaerales archaeon]